MTIHTFTVADRQQRGFRALRESLEARVALLREKNDGELDAIQTATLRGQIKELKALLRDMEEARPVEFKKGRPGY